MTEVMMASVVETSGDTDPDRRFHELTTNRDGKVRVATERSCGSGSQGAQDLEDSVEMDWAEKEVCIKCDKGGKLLVCCDRNCPLAVHEECLRCPAWVNSNGNFYCPYCSYKHAMLEAHKSRKKAMLAEKALSVFLDMKIMDGGLQKQKTHRVGRKGPNPSLVVGYTARDDTWNRLGRYQDDDRSVQVPEYQRDEQFDPECATSALTCEGIKPSTINEQNDDLSSFADNERPDGAQHKRGIVKQMHPVPLVSSGGGGGACREDDTGNTFEILQTSKKERVLQDELDASVSASHVDKETQVRGALHNSTEGELDNEDAVKEDGVGRPEKEKWGQDEQIQEQERGTNIFSGGGDSNQQERADVWKSSLGNGGDASQPWRDIEKKKYIGVQPPNVNHPRGTARKAFGLDTNVVHKGQKYSCKSRKQLTNLTIFSMRRKKLPWRVDEEEMLKEGVQKFSTVANKNLPWRKILEFGQHVFDGTRTPNDLKDKWRNILVKDGLKNN